MNLSISSRAFRRKGSSRHLVKLLVALSVEVPTRQPSSLNNSSFSCNEHQMLQNHQVIRPRAASIRLLDRGTGHRHAIALCSIDVPERCAPAMQIAVWVSAILFAQRPYRTTLRWTRQAIAAPGPLQNLVARIVLQI